MQGLVGISELFICSPVWLIKLALQKNPQSHSADVLNGDSVI